MNLKFFLLFIFIDLIILGITIFCGLHIYNSYIFKNKELYYFFGSIVSFTLPINIILTTMLFSIWMCDIK